MDERIFLCLCHMSGREKGFIDEAFAGNWIVPLGPNVTGFEKDLEEFVNSRSAKEDEWCPDGKEDFPKRVVALSSGTAAIHLALVALGVGPGDEVIVQSFTFSASANPVTYVGATPVFVDSEPETWNISPELLDEAIAARIKATGKKPKAIVPVYLYGMPARINEIMAVADKWGIPVIEDSAEAFGSRYEGRMCGTFGKFGVLSFNGNKMITTSGGGALICPDEATAKLVTGYATQSREACPWYEHKRVGFNYRLSNVCAGIGRGQMTIADVHIAHHRRVQQRYRELFSGFDGLELHDNAIPGSDSNFWLCTVTFDADKFKSPVEGVSLPEHLRRVFEAHNIETRQLWKPMHLQPFFAEAPAYVNGISENLFSRGICLPSGPWVGDGETSEVARVLTTALNAVRR